MNPRRTLQENESALRKVLTQRTLEALSKQNVAFVLEHQNDTLEQLSAYYPPAWTLWGTSQRGQRCSAGT